MSGYLLDTNVVSELTKEDPNPAVEDYLNTQSMTYGCQPSSSKSSNWACNSFRMADAAKG